MDQLRLLNRNVSLRARVAWRACARAELQEHEVAGHGDGDAGGAGKTLGAAECGGALRSEFGEKFGVGLEALLEENMIAAADAEAFDGGATAADFFVLGGVKGPFGASGVVVDDDIGRESAGARKSDFRVGHLVKAKFEVDNIDGQSDVFEASADGFDACAHAFSVETRFETRERGGIAVDGDDFAGFHGRIEQASAARADEKDGLAGEVVETAEMVDERLIAHSHIQITYGRGDMFASETCTGCFGEMQIPSSERERGTEDPKQQQVPRRPDDRRSE